MRLTEFEIKAIKEAAAEIFGENVQVLLFGSRVDDSKKGGDIDLFVKAEVNDKFASKIKFLLALERKMGEQKIDVVFAEDNNRAIEQQALSTGIWL